MEKIEKIKTNVTNTVEKFKKKIYLIMFMNIIDGLATYVGVTYYGTTEMNKIMVNVVDNIRNLLIFKIFIPTILLSIVLIVINKYQSKFQNKKFKLSMSFINICFVIYTIAMLFHILWLLMVIFNCY